MADLQDVPVTESERRGLSALAPLAGVSPSGLTPGGGKMGRPIAQANIQLELPEFDPKNLPEWAEEFAEFLLLTGQSHVDVATKCSLLKRSCKKKFLQKQVKQIVKTCSTWAEVLLRLEKTFPVYETDLSVRTQIEELPMLPEFPSAARISEYVCDMEYLFSRMNVGSYGATEPHLWLMSKIPQRTWDDCRSTSERKSRTHSYDTLVDLLIELALERENDSHMEKFLKKHLGRGGTPTPERGEGKGHKNPTNTNQGGGKGRGNLRAMNEVPTDAGTPPLFYCRPVNDKGGPCHASDCDLRSGCMLQMKRQQHTKDGKTVTHQDHLHQKMASWARRASSAAAATSPLIWAVAASWAAAAVSPAARAATVEAWKAMPPPQSAASCWAMPAALSTAAFCCVACCRATRRLQGTPQARSQARATSLWSGATLLLELARIRGLRLVAIGLILVCTVVVLVPASLSPRHITPLHSPLTRFLLRPTTLCAQSWTLQSMRRAPLLPLSLRLPYRRPPAR